MSTYTYRHPHPAVAVDIAIFTIQEDTLKVLLIQRGVEPYAGYWALPGGFVGIDEDLEAAARRELEEETSLRSAYLEQLGAFGAPDRDPRERVISVAYYAALPDEGLRILSGSDARRAAWFRWDEIDSLAFDHDRILELAYDRLVRKLRTTTVALQFLPAEFTLSDLQRVHESVLGEPVDKRNFQKWAKASAFIAPTGKKFRGGQHRPAELYRAVGANDPQPVDQLPPRQTESTRLARQDAELKQAFDQGYRAGAEQVHKLFVSAYRSTIEGK